MGTYTLVGNKYTIKNIFFRIFDCSLIREARAASRARRAGTTGSLSRPGLDVLLPLPQHLLQLRAADLLQKQRRRNLLLKDSRRRREKGAGKGATDLKLLLLHGDLRVDAAAFVAAHRPQLVFVEGEELGPGEDPQTVNRPAETTPQLQPR